MPLPVCPISVLFAPGTARAGYLILKKLLIGLDKRAFVRVSSVTTGERCAKRSGGVAVECSRKHSL